MLAARGEGSPLDRNGSWEFRFEEGAALVAAANPAFVATESMCVPDCFDALPKEAKKRGKNMF